MTSGSVTNPLPTLVLVISPHSLMLSELLSICHQTHPQCYNRLVFAPVAIESEIIHLLLVSFSIPIIAIIQGQNQMIPLPESNSQYPGTDLFSVSTEAKLYCDIICLLFITVAQVEQNILITALTVNEFRCLGICTHIIFSPDKLTSNTAPDQARRWRPTISAQRNTTANMPLLFSCVFI